jgi:NADH-quinone oxidoreductase subunit K
MNYLNVLLNDTIRKLIYILDDLLIITQTEHIHRYYSDLLFFSVIIFITGFMILALNKKNLIIFILGVELILLSLIVNFTIFGMLHGSISGQVYSLFIITLAAAEAAIGLSLVICAYNVKKSLSFKAFNNLT